MPIKKRYQQRHKEPQQIITNSEKKQKTVEENEEIDEEVINKNPIFKEFLSIRRLFLTFFFYTLIYFLLTRFILEHIFYEIRQHPSLFSFLLLSFLNWVLS